MSDFSLILFDDRTAREWEPFALTRPAGELLFGALTLRERAERVFGASCIAHVAARHLEGFEEDGAPPVAIDAGAAAADDRLFWLSRAMPDWSERARWSRPERSGPIALGERIVGWFSAAGDAPPRRSSFWIRAGSPRRRLPWLGWAGACWRGCGSW